MIKKDKVKQNKIQANSIKISAGIIKLGRSCEKILFAVANLLSITKTTEDSTDSILQAIVPLSSETIKGIFTRMVGNIYNFPGLKKQMFTLDIESRYYKDIIKEGAK